MAVFCRHSPNDRHPCCTCQQAAQREELLTESTAPQQRVHDKVACNHFDARRIYEHACRDRAHQALDEFEVYYCHASSAVVVYEDERTVRTARRARGRAEGKEANRDAAGHSDGEQPSKCRLEPGELAFRTGEASDTDAKREPFEELVEDDGDEKGR